jgi:hypothetical protein
LQKSDNSALNELKAIDEAFNKFKESKTLDEFKGLGFDDFFLNVRNRLGQLNKIEVEALTIQLIESGKCLESKFQKNKDNIVECLKNEKNCKLSSVKVVYAIFGCIPNELSEFIVDNFDKEIENLLGLDDKIEKHLENLENDLNILKEDIKELKGLDDVKDEFDV